MSGTIKHSWNGTILTIESDSGISSMDLKGAKGDDGARGAQGAKGERGGGALINDNTISTNETWSSSGIMDRFSEAMAYTGKYVVCSPIANLPFDITTNIEYKQDGSGDVNPSNIRAIRGMSAVNVVRSGKNLIDLSELCFDDNIYAHKYNKGNTTADKLFALLKNSVGKTLTLSASIDGTKSNVNIGEIRFYSSNETLLFNLIPGKAFIVNEVNEDYNALYIYGSATGAKVDDIQLEVGETATTYEPYKGNTFTMDLGQTVYGGSVDWNMGKMMLEWACKTFDGTEGWVINGATSNYPYFILGSSIDIGENTLLRNAGLCSHFPFVNLSTSTNNQGINGKNKAIYLRWSELFTSVAELKAYLAAQAEAGTPVQVAYKLATPMEVSITPQIIKAISGTNVLTTDAKELIVFGRVDTMATIKRLEERIAALEAAANGGV